MESATEYCFFIIFRRLLPAAETAGVETMDRKSLKQAPIYVRDAYNHAIKQAPSDLDGAIRTLVKVVREYPEVAATREKLREFELAKTRGMNPLVRAFWMMLSPIPFLLIKLKAIRDPYGALSLCEGPLVHCVDNPLILLAMADAGEDCEAMFISAEALEIFHEFHPSNEGVARRMAEAFQRDGRAREALKVLQEISRRHPADLSMQAELRSAIALASIERGKWEEEGTTQSKAADAKAAITQQLMDGSIHDADQAKMLIEKFTEDLKTNDSVDIRRKLADAYMVAEDFEAAQRELKIVAKKLGALDPSLDKSIEKAYIAQINQAIRELKRNPTAYEQPEAQIAQLEAQKEQYRLDRAVLRVETYPNDTQLRYDLGEIYLARNEFEKAIPHYTEALHSPQKKTACHVRLGLCLVGAGKPKEAVAEFELSLKELHTMKDKLRVDAVYGLGLAHEALGEPEKALECFREVYQVRPKYRDVAARVEGAQKPAESAAEPAPEQSAPEK